MPVRYAIYFTPQAHHPLTEAAAGWLGRDAFAPETSSLPEAAEAAGFDRDTWFALTADPRRYGFHATLKAPFALAEATDRAGLTAALDAYCAVTAPVTIDRLVIRRLGAFFALVPDVQGEDLSALAQSIVEHFEPFRAPLTPEAIAKRKPESLTERQRQQLERFGYPYVGTDFMFHMTLTGPVPEAEADRMEQALHRHFADFVDRPLAVDGLALFVEPHAGADFSVGDYWLLSAKG